MTSQHNKATPGRMALWVLRTLIMVPIGVFFLSVAFTNDGEAFGTAILVITGLIILYVEGWAWWNRVFK